MDKINYDYIGYRDLPVYTDKIPRNNYHLLKLLRKDKTSKEGELSASSLNWQLSLHSYNSKIQKKHPWIPILSD